MSKHFAEVLKLIRNCHSLNQEGIAAKLDRSAAQIGLYEQNRANPSYEVLSNLVSEFDVDANLLFPRHGKVDHYQNAILQLVPSLNEKQKKALAEHLCSMLGFDIEQFKAGEND